jgi:UDP-2,4-diacetamido-2,4,6-trideoxy-beta-L-altropyranose hydrolase
MPTGWSPDQCSGCARYAGCGAQLGTVDLLVVDHYALDAVWERVLRPAVHRILVIDDLADRPHDADFLLDQNYYRPLEGRYQGLLPSHCQCLLGPSYALLRPDFAQARR